MRNPDRANKPSDYAHLTVKSADLVTAGDQQEDSNDSVNSRAVK